MSSRQMALSGVLSALAVVLLLLGGVIPAATFCAPLLAMVVLLPVLEECGPRLAAAAWAAVSILALLLVTDRELALVYAAFGWYPILRPHVAKLPSKAARLAVKLLICNSVIFLLYGLVLRLLGLTADLLESTRLLNAALLVLANVIFLLLDLVLARMTNLWQRKLRITLFKK